jgi:excisionase family DNA binding protein
MAAQVKEQIDRSTSRSDTADLMRLESALAEIGPKTPVTLAVNGQALGVPYGMAQLLGEYASLLRRGLGASLVPLNRHLSTQEAADILGVSRPYFVRLVDSGEIPHVKVGNRRRLVLQDVLEYKHARDAVRRDSLRELVRLDHEQGVFALERECG